MKKKSNKSSQEDPVLIVPNDPLHVGLEKAAQSMTPEEWVRKVMKMVPPKTRPSTSPPQESRGPSIEHRIPTDAENEEDERIANARGRRRPYQGLTNP
jgi:hypothetical protein